MKRDPAADALAAVAPLVGGGFTVLHPDPVQRASRTERVGDWDCAVSDLDPMWPLRLTGGWRVVQRTHHEVRGWCWLLDRDGDVVAVDTLDDPEGLGPLSFPTRLALQDGRDPQAVRGAYLVSKRLAKSAFDQVSWELIGRLSRSDPSAFKGALSVVIGPRATEHLLSSSLDGLAPLPDVADLVRRQMRRWRFRDPRRCGAILGLTIGRLAGRVARPTGMVVLICGPDGTGKSTLAGLLPGSTAGVFTKAMGTHWRPGLLPRPGKLAGRLDHDVTAPHSRQPHGPVVSAGLLAYYWTDFLIGGWVKQWPLRVQNGLAVIERGWWDIAVDPLRYRLRVSARLVRAMGTLLPAPQLSLILQADPEDLLTRKAEISRDELHRQISEWPSQLPRRSARVVLDVSAPIEIVARVAREAVLGAMERQTAAGLGPGWISLPPGGDRWSLPRGPRLVAKSALSVYQPITMRASLGWHLARMMASSGVWHLLPRSAAPDPAVRELLAPHVPQGGTIAVARANHPGRYTALLLDQNGAPTGIAKVATDTADREALQREMIAIRAIGSLLPPPMSPPTILSADADVLVFATEHWTARWRAWELDPDVAYAMGVFGRSGEGGRGPIHGDFTPWNLLKTARGWTLIDWEEARHDADPCIDLIHYLVTTHVLIGRPNSRQLFDGQRYRSGWVGAAIDAYLEGSGRSPDAFSSAFFRYLSNDVGKRPPHDPWARATSRSRFTQLRP